MFIVLELRKSCSLQKGVDHSDSIIRCGAHYHTLISAVHQNTSGEQFGFDPDVCASLARNNDAAKCSCIRPPAGFSSYTLRVVLAV